MGVPRALGPRRDGSAKNRSRSRNVLLIPGTSSVGHLRENLSAAALKLPTEALEKLDSIGGGGLGGER